MYAPVLVTPPAETPISLAEAKVHLHVDGDDEDDMIEALVAAAVAHVDGYTGILGQALVTQTWQVLADDFMPCMRLPIPAATVSSVKSRNAAGQLATVASGDYALRQDALGSYVRFNDDYVPPSDLAETQGVAIEFTAGFGAAADVPADIKAALLLLVGHWYANREAVNVGNITTELPMAVDALLSKRRRVGL